MMGVELIDHLIIGDHRFITFKRKRLFLNTGQGVCVNMLPAFLLRKMGKSDRIFEFKEMNDLAIHFHP